MLYKKKESVNGTYAKKGTDINDGDLITILDEGKQVEGQFGIQNVFTIKTTSGEYLMSLNQTSINSLVDEYGEESSGWVNKVVKIHAIKQNVSGKFINVFYVAPVGYEMGESGFEKVAQQKEEVIAIGEDGEQVPF